MSTSADHDRVKEVLFAAEDLPATERRAFVERSLANDARLLHEALSLLGRYDSLGNFLVDGIELPRAAPELPDELPETLGKFKITELLGYGGMGVVYLAEMPSPRQLVALKLLRLEVATEAARRRFAREAEVLARLDHPGIARVHEAGVVDTELGPMSYIAMQYVRGEALLRYAKRHGLDRDARLRLGVALARAVQHAHELGVIHRDLKPDNVLVDARGQVKVLDFGVAHVRGDEAEASLLTRTGQVVGTIAYMSPEQARGGRVDERTDVYSLGIVLYELLTGELPFDTRPGHALLPVFDRDPRPPSRLDASLRGDLETVLLKALETDPARRYRSAGQLADELERVLGGYPILARAPSRAYLATRFLRRHRGLSASVGAVILALGGGLYVSVEALAEAKRERAVVLQLSDELTLDQLEDRAASLWPAVEALLPELDAWLQAAEGLASRLVHHRERLFELTDNERPTVPSETDLPWLRTKEAGLVERLERFLDPDPRIGLLANVQARRTHAATMRSATIDAHAANWERVLARVGTWAGFANDELQPQPGLVPLGPDPASGLEEFALYGATGALPDREEATGALRLDEDTTLVFVLLPGGPFTGGWQNQDSAAPRYEDRKQGNGTIGVVSARLEPFLISKYELTQAQWQRVTGENPSYWSVGKSEAGVTITGLHPVEHVDQLECKLVLKRLGLELPTELQWEYAARGGTDEPYWFGADFTRVAEVENCGRLAGQPIDDGYSLHAPVGSFRPNPFGLFDTLGNVSEWCRDPYKVDWSTQRLRPGDGLVLAEDDAEVSRRGGAGFSSGKSTARVAWRGDGLANMRNATVGVRPVRRWSTEIP